MFLHMRAVQYAVENLPFHDPVLQNALFVDYKHRDAHRFKQVEFFVAR